MELSFIMVGLNKHYFSTNFNLKYFNYFPFYIINN